MKEAIIKRSLTDHALISMVWQLASRGFEVFGRIAVMLVLARLLDPHAFGIASAALVVFSLAITITQLGVGPAIVQIKEITQEHISSGFIFSIAMGFLGAISLIILAVPIADFFNMPELKAPVLALALCFPLATPVMVAEALLMRDLSFKVLAYIDTISFLLGYSLLGIGLALAGFGVWSLVAAQLGQLVLRGIMIVAVKRHPLTWRVNSEALMQLLKTGSGHTLAELGNFVALQAPSIVVGRLMGASTLGLYTRAYMLLAQPARLVGLVFDRVLFPAMANVQSDFARLQRAYIRALAGVAFVMIPGSVFLVVLANEIVDCLLGNKWSEMVLPFQILAFSLLFRTSYKISDSVARATGATYGRAWRQWVYAGFVFIFAWVGSGYGIEGVSFGVGVAVFINYVLMMHLGVAASQLAWSKILKMYLRVFLGLIPTLVIMIFATEIGRYYGLPSLGVILCAGFVCVITFIATLSVRSNVFGDEGKWLRSIVLERIIKRKSKKVQ